LNARLTQQRSEGEIAQVACSKEPGPAPQLRGDRAGVRNMVIAGTSQHVWAAQAQ
jgi:hypothetical protein